MKLTSSKKSSRFIPAHQATNPQKNMLLSILITAFCLVLMLSMVRSTSATSTNAPLLAEEIIRTSVSGCYQNNGSKSTVSIVIDWDTIGELTVSLNDGDQIRIIDTEYTAANIAREIPTLQEIAFELDADGTANQKIEVYYSDDPSNIIASTTFDAPQACEPTACADGQLGGIVFKDFNLNGERENGETSGVQAITVTATDINETVHTTATDRYGLYTLDIPSADYPVRIEFSDIPFSPYLSTSTPAGANNGTTVQFASSPTCTVDLGVTNPLDSCGTDDPMVVTSCYISGDPLADGSGSANMDVLVGIDYSASGTSPDIDHIAVGDQMGATWGQAYNVLNETLYSAAFLRRHVGLGPDGLGAIYATDMSNASSSSYASTTFLDLMDGSFSIDLGTVDSNADRGLLADITQPSTDAQTFVDVGKKGIGDIDADPFNDKLWFVNLNERTLHSLIIDSDEDSTTSPTDDDLDTFAIPEIDCQNGTQRPWATKVHDGGVYVGVVCDAANGTIEDLQAAVLRYDILVGWEADPIMQFPLAYPKGEPLEDRPGALWNPWTDVWLDEMVDGLELTYPQPVLSDIEFDIDGSMVLAFGDRTGFQAGWYNVDPDGNGFFKTNVGGDLLRAYFGGDGVYLLENNGTAGPTTGFAPDNRQGPGLGEFYNDNFWGTIHTENAMGSVAILPGSGQVVSTNMDPVDFYAYSGGFRYLNNSGEDAGSVDHAAVLYTSGAAQNTGTLGKAAGLGDVELICRLPEVLEIGNRIWLDPDEDGIQDPDEVVAQNVTVILYDSTGNEVARTETNAEGTYLFSAADGLLPNTDYYIVVDPAEFEAGGDLDGNIYPTLPFGSNSQHDSNAINLSISNDSSLPSNLEGQIGASVTTGDYNQNDHSVDMGFAPEPVIPIIGDTVWLDLNQDGAQDSDEPGVPNVVVHLYNDEGVLVNTTTTNADGKYIFKEESNGNDLIPDGYYIVVEPPEGYEFTGQNTTGDDTNDSDVDPETGVSDTLDVGVNSVNLTFDAGLIPIMSIGSTVFYDLNDNGIKDGGGDTGISNVVVELYDSDDNLLASTTTDADGNYFFGNLQPGDYYLRIPTPPSDAPNSSSVTESDPNSDVDNDDNGIQSAEGDPVVSNLITLVGGAEPTDDAETGSGGDLDSASDINGNMTVDFGFFGEALAVTLSEGGAISPMAGVLLALTLAVVGVLVFGVRRMRPDLS